MYSARYLFRLFLAIVCLHAFLLLLFLLGTKLDHLWFTPKEHSVQTPFNLLFELSIHSTKPTLLLKPATSCSQPQNLQQVPASSYLSIYTQQLSFSLPDASLIRSRTALAKWLTPVLVVLVISSANGRAQRAQIRDSWALAARQVQVPIFFVLGKSQEHEFEAVIEEQRKYGDLLIFDVEENLLHHTAKLWASLHYVQTQCVHVSFVLQVQEDVLLNWPHVWRLVRKIQAQRMYLALSQKIKSNESFTQKVHKSKNQIGTSFLNLHLVPPKPASAIYCMVREKHLQIDQDNGVNSVVNYCDSDIYLLTTPAIKTLLNFKNLAHPSENNEQFLISGLITSKYVQRHIKNTQNMLINFDEHANVSSHRARFYWAMKPVIGQKMSILWNNLMKYEQDLLNDRRSKI